MNYLKLKLTLQAISGTYLKGTTNSTATLTQCSSLQLLSPLPQQVSPSPWLTRLTSSFTALSQTVMGSPDCYRDINSYI